MPIKPKVQTLTKNSAEILNAIRNQEGAYYQSVVPTANTDLGNIKDIGQIIMANPELSNAFLSALMNRIGRVIITSKMYSNPWEMFKKGLMEFGETVEEIFVSIADPKNFDPIDAENTVFKRTLPDVKTAFHTMNYQKHYDTTVSDDQLRQAFLSSQGITDLIGKIIDSLYTSANYDEFITMKYLIGRQALKGAIKTTSIPGVNKMNASDIMTEIKGVSNDLEFFRADYNPANVLQLTKKEDQYLIMTSRFNAVVDVNVLALSFNMEKAEFLGHIVPVDSFNFNAKELSRLDMLFGDDLNYKPITPTENELLLDLPCVLIDREWFMVFDNFQNMTEQYNGKGLYWNYWYHVWKTFSISPFANATMFTPTNTVINSVNISPSKVSLSPGAKMQFTSKVVGTGFVDQSVTWAFGGSGKPGSSTIDSSGLLTVGQDATGSFTVTATSVANTEKTFGAMVTVVAP